MRRLPPLVRAVAVVLCLLPLAVPAASAGGDTGGIPWIEDWGAALARAKERGLPLLIDFHTTWCAFCRKLEVESFGDPGVAALAREHFVCASLDADVQKSAALRYRPGGFPTVVFATPDGEEIWRFEGYRDAGQLREILERIATVAPRVIELRARSAADRKDPEPLLELARIYLDLGDGNLAAPLLRRAGRLLPREDAPRQAEAMLLLARAERLAGNEGTARKVLRKLLRRYPDTPAGARARAELGKRG